MSWRVSAVALVLVLIPVITVAQSTSTPADTLAPLLDTLANGKDTISRIQAAKRLGALRDPRGVDPLVAVLGDATRDVRWGAIEALGEIGDRRAVPALVEYLKKPEAYRWGKRLLADALGAIGDPAALPSLVTLLGDEDPFVRRVAALAILRIGDAGAAAKVAELARDANDETLGSVRRELARAQERQPSTPVAASVARNVATPVLLPHEWGGVRVGSTALADLRKRLGSPLQETPDFLLYQGERLPAPLKVDSVVVNADAKGVVESIFVFPAWGTVDRDVRALLGRGKVMTYGEFLTATGRTAVGAGTRAGGKLHYVPQDMLTESYAEMGVLIVYDGDASAREHLVKFMVIE
jgi:HEAT repeat protein